ncbi:MAG: SDR family oxidoreductase [Solirubrobacterales bacterium]
MSGRLRDLVVVVTGAGRGQGAAECRVLAAEGATVIGVDREIAVDDPGDGITRRILDVTDAAGWESLAEAIGERHGRVDGLVNNAGITSRVRLGAVELDEWNRVLAVNVTAPMQGIQALLPLMGVGASIVNVGSVAGLTGHYTAAYTTSKWALRGLTQCAATELGPRGIRTNIVHPGYVETPMTDAAPAAFRDINIDLTPLGRTGTPEDLAAVVAFLLAPESGFLNGAEIAADGGFTGGAGAKAISDALRRAAEAEGRP